MKITKIRMLLIILVLALCAPAVYAYPNDTGRAHGKELKGKMEAKQQELYKDLNLTDQQKKSLEENKNKHKEQTKALRNEMKEKRDLLRQELQRDELNMGKINQTNNDLKNLQAKMLDDRLASILEVRNILTPEQFKKFISKMEEHGKPAQAK